LRMNGSVRSRESGVASPLLLHSPVHSCAPIDHQHAIHSVGMTHLPIDAVSSDGSPIVGQGRTPDA
jgi:hypothetical protein